MGISLDRDKDVFVLTMDGGENRMNRPWLDAMNGALDEVDAAPDPAKALVTTGSGRPLTVATSATLPSSSWYSSLEP